MRTEIDLKVCNKRLFSPEESNEKCVQLFLHEQLSNNRLTNGKKLHHYIKPGPVSNRLGRLDWLHASSRVKVVIRAARVLKIIKYFLFIILQNTIVNTFVYNLKKKNKNLNEKNRGNCVFPGTLKFTDGCVWVA